ncbi:hypothetical protein NFI95_15645 [Acetobacteraceae bacterium KSS8]|uniref:Uncharacterized protein n=1 Tax=Endosaccharibacter trunci TaxID=2812733 RepID=A0ABT1WAW5_9PROT|nr:hypothetical protein [Acetobacteraceae bacterium KSS8]
MADFHIRLPGILLTSDPKIIVGDVTYDLSPDRLSYRPRVPVFLCGGGRTVEIGTVPHPDSARGYGWTLERVAALSNGSLKPCARTDTATPNARVGVVVWEREIAERLVGFEAVMNRKVEGVRE